MKTNRYKFTAYEVAEAREAYGEERLDDGLIMMAEERTRVYFMPALWTVTHHADGSATVTRYHN